MDNLVSFVSGIAGAVIGAALSYYFTIRIAVRQQEHNTARALRQLYMEAEDIARDLAWLTYETSYRAAKDPEKVQRQSRGRERLDVLLLQIGSQRYDLSDERARALLAQVTDYFNLAESLVYQFGPQQVAREIKVVGESAVEAINAFLKRRHFEPSADFNEACKTVKLYNEIMEEQYQAQLEWEREERQKTQTSNEASKQSDKSDDSTQKTASTDDVRGNNS